MNMLSDIIESAKKYFQEDGLEKSRKPFISAYIISFIIYNWEVFYLFLITKDELLWMEKIQALKIEITRKESHLRVLVPIYYSFISIVLFYTFTYTSKGLYMFFSRWFDNFILSKFGEKLPYSDQYIRQLESENESIRKLIDSSRKEKSSLTVELDKKESEIKLINKNNKDISAQLLNKSNEIRKLELQINYLEAEKENRKICFAEYYTERYSFNVIKQVETLLNNNGDIDINNSIFGDPEKYIIKKFKMGYVFKNEYKEIHLIEDEKLVVDIEGFKGLMTSKSKINKDKSEYIEKFSNEFGGVFYFYTIKGSTKEIRITKFTKDGHFLVEKTNQIIFTVLEAKKLIDGYSLRIIGDGTLFPNKTNENIYLSSKNHIESKIEVDDKEYYITNNPFIFKGQYKIIL